MKRMKIFTMFIVLAVTMVTGCGKVEDTISIHPTESIADEAELPEQGAKVDKTEEETESSNQTMIPVEDEKPDAEEKRAEGEKPDAEEKRAESEKPDAAKKPAENKKPDAEEKRAEDEKTDAAEKPAESEEPEDNQAANTEQAVPSEPAQPSEPASSEPAGGENAGSAQPHEHNWIDHTNQRWVSQIVTVVDEPERYEPYGMYKIYWYNTGNWEETRDPDRFAAWCYDEEGGPLSTYRYSKPEDNPLFLGYDENGHASFTGDHVLWTAYDYIPAVTHEEDQGYYETYVDYCYCDCGATK